MKTPNTAKVVLVGAAMAGLLGGTAVRLQAAELGSHTITLSAGQLADSSDSGVHSCKGMNSCKGQGGCKSSDQGCKAKNTCKGKGGCATSSTKA